MMSLTAVIVLIVVLSTFGWGRRNRRSPEELRRLRDLEQAVAARDEEVDLLHQRVAELENRLDFTERLLSKGESGER